MKHIICPALSLALLLFGACSTSSNSSPQSDTPSTMSLGPNFSASGTIILSRQIPNLPAEEEAPAKPEVMMPLLGYFPPAEGFLPAQNEMWLEVSSTLATLTLYQGKSMLKTLRAEGLVDVGPGNYLLQSKQKKPLWYAPDDYYLKRQLEMPPPGDKTRFLRGALGDYAFYLTESFPIHAAPVWTSDVGGLKLSAEDLGSLFEILPVGTQVVIK